LLLFLLGVFGTVGAGSVDTVPASVYLAASDPDSECDPGGSCTACNPPPDWDLLADRLEAES
jgi:hypothetical protein